MVLCSVVLGDLPMKHPLSAIVALVVVASFAAGCGAGSSGTETVPPGSDATTEGGTAACGGSGEPCCNGTACNAGLVCSSETCAASSSADSSSTEDAAANPADDGAVGDAAGEAASVSEAGETDDAGVTDATLGSGDAVVADVAADNLLGPETGVDSSADGTVADASADTGSDAGAGDASDAGCAVDTLTCSGQQAQICTSSGTWRSVGGPCSGSAPVCLAGACVACAPGSMQCNAAGDGVELCGTEIGRA